MIPGTWRWKGVGKENCQLGPESRKEVKEIKMMVGKSSSIITWEKYSKKARPLSSVTRTLQESKTYCWFFIWGAAGQGSISLATCTPSWQLWGYAFVPSGPLENYPKKSLMFRIKEKNKKKKNRASKGKECGESK